MPLYVYILHTNGAVGCGSRKQSAREPEPLPLPSSLVLFAYRVNTAPAGKAEMLQDSDSGSQTSQRKMDSLRGKKLLRGAVHSFDFNNKVTVSTKPERYN